MYILIYSPRYDEDFLTCETIMRSPDCPQIFLSELKARKFITSERMPLFSRVIILNTLSGFADVVTCNQGLLIS